MLRRLYAITVGPFALAFLSVVLSGQANTAIPRVGRVTIAGSVVDAELMPMANVAITLEQHGRTAHRTTTAVDGTFRLIDVEPGDYRVQASHPSAPVSTRDIKVPSGTRAIQLPMIIAPALEQTTAAVPDPPGRPVVARGLPSAPIVNTAAAATSPQNGSGTIAGTVTDNVGVVPGASVTATADRGATRTTTTNNSGEFRLAGLAPGRYTVKVELNGFKPLNIPAVNLRADEIRTLGRLTLTAGGANETVTVTAEITPVQTATSALTRNVTTDGVPIDSLTSGNGLSINGGSTVSIAPSSGAYSQWSASRGLDPVQPRHGERYDRFENNAFQSARDQPLSTFGADVDTASYTNVRRFLSKGQLPPTDAVRVEEFINYFRFGYAEPRGRDPIGITSEVGDCPWAPAHKLVLIGARAKASAGREIEGRNIVLLLDVSGSMSPPERLPLIKTALGMFVDTLRPDDQLAIVTYAGTSGVALPSTPARYRDTIQRAIANLSAGGSTNGASGLLLAYRAARAAFIPGGVNRVILATDGDFNVGIVNRHDLQQLIEREKESGIFLSVFGVGSDNLKDATMEMLADKGNGHYAYLDSLQEARRVLMREADGTLETVAKDVKFQVEFNPALVSSWRLVGYENRALAARDFNDDRKDGGELGAGHTVTVLYEIVPVGIDDTADRGASRPAIDPLRYQRDAAAPAALTAAARNGEWLTVKVRYKQPDDAVSDLITVAVRTGSRTDHLPFASAVAEFGLLLRDRGQDQRRWDALADRIERLSVPSPLVADKDGFGELVAIARGLERLR